jgi:hypothetical protein
MLRVLLALNFLFINLLACKGGYSICILKVKHTNVIQNQILKVPITKNKTLIYSNKKPNTKVIKHDPFLNLYLVDSNRNFKYPFRTNYKLSLGEAAVDNQLAIEGRINKEQIGLNKLANFSEVISAPSLLLNSCCALEGLVTPRGIIQKEYIDNFLKNKKVEYGDIGIRVKNLKSQVVVHRVNPFDMSVALKKGDIILEIDSKKVQSASHFMRKILFSKLGKKHTLKIKRADKILTLHVQTKKRYGGGEISDTFLEQKGLYFSKDLSIVKVSNYFKNYGLKIGDKLLQVNGKKVTGISDIRNNIDNFKFHASLLFSRDDFQFFVNVK